MANSKKQSRIRNQVKNDLLDQLARKNSSNKQYIDLVNDYMVFWDIKDSLQQDIRERGAKVTKFDSKGQAQITNNESIEQALKINKQMLTILITLNMQPPKDEVPEGDGDCDL